MKDWERFVLKYGRYAKVHDLAAVLDQPVKAVDRVRNTGACSRLNKAKRFPELFALWRGRPPRDDEWPAPRKSGRGVYEWQAPEVALVASLVGRLGKPEISSILTRRLRQRTGDRRAGRSPNAVQCCMGRIGMQASDVVGGITAKMAAREIGSYAIVIQSITAKQLRAFRVGRLWVIPRAAWAAFKASRVFPPKGYVQLSSIRQALGINSDAKLPEWASLGYVPSAVRCNPFGSKGNITRGTWFIDPKVARKLVADRRAGRPMPWWGKPTKSNLRQTWKLLVERMHPATCGTCRKIWGVKGAPRSYSDYADQYPPLAHGAKRHLTRPYSQGLTIAEVAKQTRHSWSGVRLAINNGTLRATKAGRTHYITRTDATRWQARRCPTGGNMKSWISLSGARTQYSFSVKQLRAYIAAGRLRAKTDTSGAMRGITYCLKQQVRELREVIGYSEREATKRAGVSIERLRVLLAGVDWRGAEGIPPETVRAAVRRRYSQDAGYTIEEAAAKLQMTIGWIHERKLDGTIRLSRAKWDRRRLYITEPMFQRLKAALRKPARRERFGADWLLLSNAASEAGVSTSTILNWVKGGEIPRRQSLMGWRYQRKAVRARAKRYWTAEIRFHRAVPPDWLHTPPAKTKAAKKASKAMTPAIAPLIAPTPSQAPAWPLPTKSV